MSTITREQLAEWRALCDSAPRGPWHAEQYGDHGMRTGVTISDTDWIEVCAIEGGILYQVVRPNDSAAQVQALRAERAVAVGRFIVAASTAMPALLDEVERLREYERLRSALAEPEHVRYDRSTLLPCPFCGCDVYMRRTLRGGHLDGEPDAWAYYVVCRCCAAQGPWYKTVGNAARGWNERALRGEGGEG